MKIKEIMSANPITLREDDSIYNASRIMKDNDVGVIPVVSDDMEILGIVTDRDIVLRTFAEKGSLNSPVKTIMSNNITSVDSQNEVDEAIRLMSEHRVRRLPVTENGRLTGMLSVGDIAVTDDYLFEISDMLYEISK